MVRARRLCPEGIPQHLIQRGNNRQLCFADTKDFAVYTQYLKEVSQRYHVSIHAWVFMNNHVHLLATPQHTDSLSRMMQTLGRKYVAYFNAAYQRSGTLWEGRFRSCLVQSAEYLLQCYRYIELNPVRANMVCDPADYPWSSYRCNALGLQSGLIQPHPEYLSLGENALVRQQQYRQFFTSRINTREADDLRLATNKNLVFGSDQFKDEIEAALQQRARPGRPGRPKK